jgi:signal peptidase I
MGSDFSTILVAVLAVCGAIVLADVLFLKRRRLAANGHAPVLPAGSAQTQPAGREPAIVGLARGVFPVLLLVVLFRSFVFEPFRIPSASMMPGLVDGDFILVNKFSYGLRLPVLNTKVLPVGEPKRGDVIVFRSTSGPPITLIKRLIGLPGDHVVVRDNRLVINGKPVPLVPDGRYTGGYGFTGSKLEKEALGPEHVIMLAPQRRAADFDAVVPAGHYFFMGDNRNDSEDSRFADVGFVPEDHLVGHAVRIWMNWRIPDRPHWGRIGMRIR